MFNQEFCSSFEILFGAIVDFVLWIMTETFEQNIVILCLGFRAS